MDFIPWKVHCSKAKHCDLALTSTEPKYLAFLVTLDLVVVYMALSHEENKQRSSKISNFKVRETEVSGL